MDQHVFVADLMCQTIAIYMCVLDVHIFYCGFMLLLSYTKVWLVEESDSKTNGFMSHSIGCKSYTYTDIKPVVNYEYVSAFANCLCAPHTYRQNYAKRTGNLCSRVCECNKMPICSSRSSHLR